MKYLYARALATTISSFAFLVESGTTHGFLLAQNQLENVVTSSLELSSTNACLLYGTTDSATRTTAQLYMSWTYCFSSALTN